MSVVERPTGASVRRWIVRTRAGGMSLAIACTMTPVVASAQLDAENVLVELPAGYHLGYENKTARAGIFEMIPTGETVENWTEMVTTQTFFNPTVASPSVLMGNFVQIGKQVCADFESAPFAEAVENGYPVVGWFSKCPNNTKTGKPEWTLSKAIRGQDAMYLVQKAFKFEPSPEQVKQGSVFLRRVLVCDTRSSEHPCPSSPTPQPR